MAVSGLTPVIAVILASHPPEQLGQLPPALEPLDGVPIVAFALQKLRAAKSLADSPVVVVAPACFTSEMRSAIAGVAGPLSVIDGGETEDASIHLALDELAADDNVLVVIHDACRPLTPASLIDRVVIASADSDGRAVAPVLAMTETVKVLDAVGRVVQTVPRDSVVRVQTPQVARLSAIRRAHAGCARDRGSKPACFVGAGADVQLVDGDELGMPVTTVADRQLASALRQRAHRVEPPVATG